MNYKRDRATVHGGDVFVGTQLQFKESSPHYAHLLNEEEFVPNATIIGISNLGIVWIAEGEASLLTMRYSISDIEENFVVIEDAEREARNISTIQLFESFGGEFHGPRVETATIDLYKLFQLIDSLTASQKAME